MVTGGNKKFAATLRFVTGPGDRGVGISVLFEMNYPWPGNVREMENAIEYALHLTDEGNPIRPEQLPPNLLSKKDVQWSPKDFVSIEEYTKQSVLVLQRDHSEEQIAEILGISRKNLWEKRKRWSLPRPEKPI